MAKLMSSNQPIETWYLAGNCIDSDCVALLAKGLEQNTAANALWLKRNPIMKEGAVHLSRMFSINSTLTLIDLHNTGLFDEGIAAICTSSPCVLKHMYLDANGITTKGNEQQQQQRRYSINNFIFKEQKSRWHLFSNVRRTSLKRCIFP